MIETVHLFSELSERLTALLRGLSAADWHRPTVCSRWCVKDIASHLLDGNMRRLSAGRDGYTPPDGPGSPESYESLVAYLDGLNADWTRATRRISPRLLVELLEQTGKATARFFATLDPLGSALYPVAWAGESESLNWFDVAREYTERWHHQRQIIDAVGQPSAIDGRRLYHPVLATFLRGLPFAFRDAPAADGTCVAITIVGEAGGDWTLRRAGIGWQLTDGLPREAAAAIRLGQDTAWRVFTKRIDRCTALARYTDIRLDGDTGLAGQVLELVSIMA